MTASIVSHPTPAQTALPTISTHNLSREAVDYLKAIVRQKRQAGMSAVDAAWYANRWCSGYRAHAKHGFLPIHTEAGGDGYEYAKGEDAYLRCLEVDAAQDSAAAAGWPSSALW